jgi:hypothetical protein
MRLPPELIPTTPEPFVEAFLRPSIEMGQWDARTGTKEDIYAIYTVYAYNI